MSNLPYAALAGGSGFQSDPRFCNDSSGAQSSAPADPVAQAWNEGYAAGSQEAAGLAAAAAEENARAQAAITLSFARLDAQLAEELRRKLFITVETLCETAIAPLALDKAALAARVERAAAMLARADDNRILRLHPADYTTIAQQLPASLEVVPDPALARGAIRVETASGGVEDGPDNWRRAIAEALGQC